MHRTKVGNGEQIEKIEICEPGINLLLYINSAFDVIVYHLINILGAESERERIEAKLQSTIKMDIII